MHVNIKPKDKNTVYETPESAILHIFLFGVYAKDWNQDGKPFGQVCGKWKAINNAIKNRDYSAFQAHKRKGYWRIELNETA